MLEKFHGCSIERHGRYLIYKDQTGRERGILHMLEIPEPKPQREPKPVPMAKDAITRKLIDQIRELSLENAELDEMNQSLRTEIKKARQQPMLREKHIIGRH